MVGRGERPRTLVGLHGLEHDSGSCIVRGKVLCAVSEERLSRKKHDGSLPERSLRYVLEYAGLSSMAEVDSVVFDRLGPPGHEDRMRSFIREEGFAGEALAIDHHDAHAASAFYSSPYERAAVLVVDGFGTWGHGSTHYLYGLSPLVREIQSLYLGEGEDLRLIRRTYTSPDHPMGIGLLFALTSEFLGFGDQGAGQVMALAGLNGHGVQRSDFVPYIRNYQGDFVGPGDRDPVSPGAAEHYAALLFPGVLPRTTRADLLPEHVDVARRVQSETEAVLLALAKELRAVTRADALCMAGGVALNCVANTRIRKEAGFRHLHVQPAAHDAGIPLGCALYGRHVVHRERRSGGLADTFHGRRYGGTESLNSLRRYSGPLKWRRSGRIEREAAEALSRGAMVGWFQGRSEFGPRSLGGRSILADPRSLAAKERLDHKIKRRESFRPYAPSVMRERVGRFFQFSGESPFMLLAEQARPKTAKLAPAVVHADGTGRLQTVSEALQPRFHGLLAEFERITGLPLVLNTSFNTSGEPIVETPDDALRRFQESGLDLLFLEDFVVERR